MDLRVGALRARADLLRAGASMGEDRWCWDSWRDLAEDAISALEFAPAQPAPTHQHTFQLNYVTEDDAGEECPCGARRSLYGLTPNAIARALAEVHEKNHTREEAWDHFPEYLTEADAIYAALGGTEVWHPVVDAAQPAPTGLREAAQDILTSFARRPGWVLEHDSEETAALRAALAAALNAATLRVDPSQVDWELASDWVRRDALRLADALLASPPLDALAGVARAARELLDKPSPSDLTYGDFMPLSQALARLDAGEGRDDG